MNDVIEKEESVKYNFYKNILESKNFKFMFHQRPFDVYSDGQTEIRICESCHILRINNQRIQTYNLLKVLVDYLFNGKVILNPHR